MRSIRSLWVCLCAAAYLGCATDGGPVGTGISSAISGNVVEVDASSGSAPTLAAPVHVSIDEAPGITDTTDSDGNFQLVGEFSGAITLRFTATAPQLVATRSLDVPAGSTTVLENVTLSPGVVEPITVRQLGFVGTVFLVDCASSEMLVNDRKAMASQFLVRLSPDTVLTQRDGQAVACGDIRNGDPVEIAGVIRLSDRTVVAITVTIGPPPLLGSPPPTDTLSFHGNVTIINCASGMLLVADPITGQSRLRLSPTTMIFNADQQPITCQDISVGDRIDGKGLIKIRRPGVIDVTLMSVRPPQL